MAANDIRRILGGLGFTERDSDGEGATWEVPSWRVDVAIEEDLVEELTRTLGYQVIPETLPRLALDTPAIAPWLEAQARTRVALEAAGFREVVSYAFVPPQDLESFDPGVRPVVLKNPISAEMAAMRTSVVPSLLRTAAFNRRQGRDGARLYELASTFWARTGVDRDPPAIERPVVAAVLTGRRSPVSWAATGQPSDFHDLKGAVEGVLAALGVDAVFEQAGRAVVWLHPRAAALVRSRDGARLGALGEIHPRVALAFDLPRGVFAFELDSAALLAAARLVPGYRPIPRLPAVLRDLAVVVDEPVARRGGHRRGPRGAAGRGGHALRRLPRGAAGRRAQEPGAGDPLPGARSHAHRRRGRRRPRADRRAAGAGGRRPAPGLRCRVPADRRWSRWSSPWPRWWPAGVRWRRRSAC